LPLAPGYDSGDNAIWRTFYMDNIEEQNSRTVGIPDWYRNREIDILENGKFAVGDTILIRFRLFSDPYAHGWGWAIDNLRIQQPVSTPLPVLSPVNISVYPNPFKTELIVSVQAKKTINCIEFDIFNMFGQKIHSIQNKNIIGELKERIDLSFASDGMYFVSVKENGRQVYSKKIIKN
jgi:hypothetical protein